MNNVIIKLNQSFNLIILANSGTLYNDVWFFDI